MRICLYKADKFNLDVINTDKCHEIAWSKA